MSTDDLAHDLYQWRQIVAYCREQYGKATEQLALRCLDAAALALQLERNQETS